MRVASSVPSHPPVRILWVVSMVIPEAAELIGVPSYSFGSWVWTMLDELRQYRDLHISVAMRAPVDRLIRKEVSGRTYYYFPAIRRFDVNKSVAREIVDDAKPDILHCEGTEFAHFSTFLSVWPGKNVVSFQGILNGYEPFETGAMRLGELFMSANLPDMITAASMAIRKHLLFQPRLGSEAETLRRASNFVGRTDWDKAYGAAHNPGAHYFSCPHILRSDFQRGSWSAHRMRRHSIFLGNASNPRKGAHIAVEAAALLRRRYPSIKLVIAGPAPAADDGVKRLVGYSAYLSRLIRRRGLGDAVSFTGVLPGVGMVEAMLGCNVYVLPSLIENSPVTLSEAMGLRIPCVAAFVGGVPQMATDEVDALLYRAEEPALLAEKISRIFENDELAARLGDSAARRVAKENDRVRCGQAMANIYRKVAGS